MTEGLVLEAISYLARDEDEDPSKKPEKNKKNEETHKDDKDRDRIKTGKESIEERKKDDVRSESVDTPSYTSSSESSGSSSEVSGEDDGETEAQREEENMRRVMEWRDGVITARRRKDEDERV